MLFENQQALNDEKMTEIAKTLQLDLDAFEADRKDPTLRAKINQDLMDGIEMGVRGTPTIYIDGKHLKNRSLDGFQAAIAGAMSRRKAKETTPSN